MPDVTAQTIATAEAAEKILAAIREVRADIGLVASDLGVVQGGLANVVSRVDLLEARKPINSDRVRAMVSEGDLAAESKLSEEIVARQALAQKVEAIDKKQDEQIDMMGRLLVLARNPVLKHILTAIGTAVLMYLASKGIK